MKCCKLYLCKTQLQYQVKLNLRIELNETYF